MRERLEACADDVEAGTEAVKLAREHRDQLVVEAVESGLSTRHVARWARLSQARVIGILARS